MCLAAHLRLPARVNEPEQAEQLPVASPKRSNVSLASVPCPENGCPDES